MAFSGFPPAAVEFYEGLEVDSSREYWQAHREAYESAVRAPMEALVAELAAEFGEAKLFRPFRDTRFSADKSPYKTHQGAFVGGGTGVGRYVEVSARGLLAGGGFRAHGPDQTRRLRAAVADEGTGTALEGIVADLEAAGFEVVGDAVATAPRGYPRDHPRIGLLRRKELMALRRFGDPRWVATRRARTEVERAWRAVTPFLTWVEENVGAPEPGGRFAR